MHVSGTTPDSGHSDLRLESVLDHILTDLKSSPVTLLVGAAASIAAPADLPDVKNFYEMFFAEVKKYDPAPAELNSLNQFLWERVPFERLMQTMRDILLDSAPNFVPNLLNSVYGRGQPNENHRAMIEQLVNRRVQLILTTNFDELLEAQDTRVQRVVTEDQFAQLADELRTDTLEKPTVAHLHGSVSEPLSLIALMNQVGKPIEGARRLVLEKILEKGTLVTIGYSSRDQDIGPVLKPYVSKKIWYLVRQPSDHNQLGPYERAVELNPLPKPPESETSPTQKILGDHLNQLRATDEADVYKLIGAINVSAGMGLVGSKRLRMGQSKKWTEAGAMAYAAASASEHLYATAAKQLSQTPDIHSPMWARWIANRAFYKRHGGQFREAAQDYAELREKLDQQLVKTGNQDLIGEMLNTLWHEIETLVLLASAQPKAERAKIAIQCENLLLLCEGWISKATQLPPMFEIDFYRGETALLKGDGNKAYESYENCQKPFVAWFGASAIALVSLRKVVALRAKKDWQGAAKLWYTGIRSAMANRSLMAMIQYLIISPVLLGMPVGWYWFTRRIAASRLYPLYEVVKIRWLKLNQPDFLST